MKSILKISSITLMLFFSSCESILDIDPQQSIDSGQALTTPEAVRANLADIYSGLKNVILYGRDFVATTEALADNTRVIDRAGGRYVQQGANAPTANMNNWAVAYATMNEINLLLEALSDVQGATPTFLDETEGQLRALRALLYFDLVRVYAYEPNMAPPGLDMGGVPLALTGVLTPGQIELLPRATVAAVYEQIYADLTIATQKAPALPAGTSTRYYANRVFAMALFAKVALYNQDFATAEQLASDAITTSSLVPATVANIVSAWRLNNHPESLFEVGFTTPGETIGVNESITSAFASRATLTATTPATGNGAVVPTAAFLALHAGTDVRLALYQNGLRTPIVMECTKFLHKTGTTYMDNIPVMRVSELYLIRAEARARKAAPDETGARSDLNLIAARVPIVYDGTTTGAVLVDAIIAQRRLELAFEGDRWFDMKRRGQPLLKTTGNLTYDDYRRLAAIPVRETQINPNLIQNSGY
jgi:hypothetical protein